MSYVVAKPDQSSPYHASQHAQLVTLVNRTNHAYISVCIGCTMDDTCATHVQGLHVKMVQKKSSNAHRHTFTLYRDADPCWLRQLG